MSFRGNARETSPRVGIDSGGDELRPEALRLDAAKGGFDIACQEGVEQVVGLEGQQGKGLDRTWIVFIVVDRRASRSPAH